MQGVWPSFPCRVTVAPLFCLGSHCYLGEGPPHAQHSRARAGPGQRRARWVSVQHIRHCASAAATS